MITVFKKRKNKDWDPQFYTWTLSKKEWTVNISHLREGDKNEKTIEVN